MSDQKPADAKELERRAVAEILEDTRRAAIRAEVGGSVSWARPSHKGFNKRFLNNTIISTVSNNCRLTGQLPPSAQADHNLIRNGVDSNNVPLVDVQAASDDRLRAVKKPIGKIAVSSKSRFKAYLTAAKAAKERQAQQAESTLGEEGSSSQEPRPSEIGDSSMDRSSSSID